MNINSQNIESFFLLYADNALTKEQQLAVDKFVTENPEYSGDFEAMMDAVLPADEGLTMNLTSLYKSNLLPANMEELLLLYVHKELNAQDAATVEQLVKDNQPLAIELALLQKAVLDAGDKTAFEGKQGLYKHTPRTLAIPKYVRWAVAAAIIGIIFFAGYQQLTATDDNDGQPSIAKIAPQPGNNVSPKTVEEAVPAQTKEVNSAADNKLVDIVIAKATKTNGQPQKMVDANGARITKVIAAANALPAANNVEVTKNKTTERPSQNAIMAVVEKPVVINVEDVNIITKRPTDAGIAMLTSKFDNQTNDRILYMDEEDLQKTKAGAFFKKMKRVIARKTNIDLGSTVHIANFEIALK